MGEGRVGLALKNGKIAVVNKLLNVTNVELSEIIINLEMMKQDLENIYRQKFRKNY